MFMKKKNVCMSVGTSLSFDLPQEKYILLSSVSHTRYNSKDPFDIYAI